MTLDQISERYLRCRVSVSDDRSEDDFVCEAINQSVNDADLWHRLRLIDDLIGQDMADGDLPDFDRIYPKLLEAIKSAS